MEFGGDPGILGASREFGQVDVHRIRLAGPWEVEWLDGEVQARGAAASLSAAGPRRVSLPARWRDLFGEAAGLARLVRRFQWPTGLDAGERVFVVLAAFAGRGEVALNEEPLGELATGGRCEFDITDRLRSTNRLTVTVTFDPARNAGIGDSFQPAVLEVRPAEDLGGP